MSDVAGQPATDGRTADNPVTTGRAIVQAVVTVALIVVGFFYVPQCLLVTPWVASRTMRAWAVTAWIGLAFILACRAAWSITGRARQPR
jgi:hypothetical protein